MKSTTFLLSLMVIASIAWANSSAQAQDWPGLRGQRGLGTIHPMGVLADSGSIELKVRWQKPLGSGYSSCVVAGNRMVTLACDDDSDFAICLDTKTGESLWKTSIGPKFVGENGSFDGPISTPLIYDGNVIVIDPSGAVFNLSLDDGTTVWTKHLIDDFGATKPLYGFATSPIVAGGKLILQTGVKNQSLAGVDLSNGDVLWTATNDSINSQTPVAWNFRGTEIVLACGGKNLVGVDPQNGTVLFEHAHGGGNAAAVVPVPMPGDRVVMTLDDMFSRAVSLRPGDEDSIEVSEEWEDRSIKNTYNIPALTSAGLYAYSTRILTCVDPETGKARWKSRQPGDGFLIAVDDHVIINTKKGSLHVARANANTYEERASITPFQDLVWSLPAYSNGAIFIRSIGEVACVDIQLIDADAPTQPVSVAAPERHLFDELVAQFKDASGPNRQKVVDEWMAGQSSFPLVDDQFVHFVYRGEGADVAVASDIFGARQERKMFRVPDTDLFCYSSPLPADQRANYMFLVDYQTVPDPRNDRASVSSVYKGEMEFAVRLRNEKPLTLSWFAMPQWQQPAYLAAKNDALAGTLEKHEVGDGVAVEVYLPPGYSTDDTTRYRCVYVMAMGGEKQGQISESVDSIFQQEFADLKPAILVYVNLPPIPTALNTFVDKIIPSIDQNYRTVAGRMGRSVVGFGFMGGPALTAVLTHADTFCGVSVYSPLLFEAELASAKEAASNLKQPVEIYVDWGRFDLFNPHENWDVRRSSQEFVDACKAADQVRVRGGMVNDSTDWSSWRNRYHEFLKTGSGN